MLRALVFLSIITHIAQQTGALAAPRHVCEKDVKDFINQSYKRMEEAKQNPAFQAFITDQKSKVVEKITESTPFQTKKGALYVFVSFSLGEKGLASIAEQANHYGAHLVLRGFKDGSYKKTVEALQKITLKTGQGFTIDPELFENFHIEAIPTIILASLPHAQDGAKQTPIHDRIVGNVTLTYALQEFEKKGDLQDLAALYLKKGEKK